MAHPKAVHPPQWLTLGPCTPPPSPGIAPYMALELATFDLLPRDKMPGFARGFAAALVATLACYPLDTLRWAELI